MQISTDSLNRAVVSAAVILLSVTMLLYCGEKRQFKKEGSPVEIHEKLSAYNIVEFNDSQLKAQKGHIPYDLVTPLFTDYAFKFRTVHIPAGGQMKYYEKEAFEFPVGSIISKTFYYPSDFSHPQQKIRLLETRLLIRQPGGWVALPYIWNDEQTDAVLTYGGRTREVSFVNAEGREYSFEYSIPGKNECGSCHQYYTSDQRTEPYIMPLGLKARHLDKDYAFNDKKTNQLDHFISLGLLNEKGGGIALVDYTDESESLNDRARSYLDINCSHCHNPRGSAGENSKLFLTFYENDKTALGVCKVPGSAGKGGGGLTYDVVPGRPEQSILWYRMHTTEEGAMMPQIGRSLRHDEGVELIHRYIKAMPEKEC